jgi:UDP-2-acetamido-2-deoxy-ribo-hexuluronate aminotransferase
MSIPFIDLKAQYAVVKDDVQRRIDSVLDSGRFIMGPEITELEKELSAFTGAKHTVACSSGTDALLMPLMAMGIGPGDAVFVPPFTFVATVEAVALLGATPVFVDIKPDTFNIDPDKLELAIQATLKGDASIYPLPAQDGSLTPKAIIPVDLFGLPADYDRVMPIAERHGLFVLEDAAQGLGGKYKGRMSGSLAHAGATSFFPAKPLGCYGDGGAVFTDDDAMLEKLLSIRVHGQGTDKYDNIRLGLNARMDTLQAAILLSKLAIFPGELQRRQQVADAYNSRLSQVNGIVCPQTPANMSNAWAQYTIRTNNRDRVCDCLRQDSVPTAVYYPIPLHQQQAYSNLGYQSGDMPVSEDMATQVMSLPMHPYLTEETIDTICSAVAKALG